MTDTHDRILADAEVIKALETENARLRSIMKEAASLLEKDARNMATAFDVTEWRKTTPHAADIIARARAALEEKNDD